MNSNEKLDDKESYSPYTERSTKQCLIAPPHTNDSVY
jgi:hypothetical protein